ncbi:hypothetical protein SEA_COMRADE_239 [Streptomyces phage Comrade]|uniref:Uncharacterized protein n=1 Tax=Streptomyces phage Comrade TaxID=2301714 RepID=A0A385DVP0_9CAUD|nr:hypothetical protein HWB84_gp039 [Streptomyces phage Comrade]AXQ63471.1 hypothetical protein SEA_COMRADE_239 [Streptomyces phage Comrade]
MAKLDHEGDKCYSYRACARCRQIQDRWDILKVTFCVLVVFTFVIPVIPVIIAIIAQVT